MVGGVCYISVLLSKISSLACSLSLFHFVLHQHVQLLLAVLFLRFRRPPRGWSWAAFYWHWPQAPTWCCFRGGAGTGREGKAKGPGSRFLSRHTRGRSRALALSGRPLPAHFRSLSVPPPGSRALPSRPDDEGEAGAACRPGPGSDWLTEGRGWRRRGGQAARLPPSGSALQLDAPSPGADSSSTSSSRRGQNYDSYCFLNFYFLIEG